VVLGLTLPGLFGQQFLGKTANEWSAQLRMSLDAKQRRNAAFALGKMGSRAVAALPDLKNAYGKEKDAKVRDALLFAMGEIARDSTGAGEDSELEPLFIRALDDDDAYVRRSAAFALGCLGKKSNQTRQALLRASNDNKAIVRQNAAWAMVQFGVEAPPLLKKALGDPDSLVKRDAATALLYLGSQDEEINAKVHEQVHALLKDLLPLCRDTNSEVRRAALNVLVRIVDGNDKEAIAPLRVAMEDRDIENRRNAALALSNIGGEETKIALPVLLEAIKNGDEELRRQSVLAIRNIGPAAAPAVKELTRLLRDDADPKLRRNAALALGGIGAAAAPASPVLLKRLQDQAEDRETRVECAMALARMGNVDGSTAIVPDLLALIGNPKHDGRIRERVMWALRVHGESLSKMNNTKETFTRILGEPVGLDNRMLRYDAAYMLGMIWQSKAPEPTLNVLAEFLHDNTILIYEKTASGVGGGGSEVVTGGVKIKESGKGDGRIMAVDALQMMGPTRYAGRGDIMKQLRVLANDNTTYEPLRKKSAELIKAARR
jgi:HEAT repeat protein